MSTPARSKNAGPAQGEPLGLTIDNVRKVYASRGRETFEAVKGMNMDIRPGELISLLGPSGCGKTTTLRMIAGLETVTSGDIRIGDTRINDLPPGKRNVGVGFESYALYPPLNIKENLAYGLKARKEPNADEQAEAIAKRLDMEDLLPMRPASLSSGQKQRVALARALIRKPPVLLLDEPLGHLDASARQRVRRELKLLQREFGYTTIVVTHDQLEAMSLSDRIAVMNGGIIQQFDTPDEIFDNPANLFVADFVGEPSINLFDGEAVVRDGKVFAKVGEGMVETTVESATNGQKVTVGIRPSDCRTGVESGLVSDVVVFEDLLEFGQASVEVRGTAKRALVQTPAEEKYEPGDTVVFAAPPARVYLFNAESGDRVR
ncbi:ABC transporter ATP-binding protein [Dermacoccus barathri]|uniref:ABC transporter ATP-binding protein n=1 Tax=Dermacoccus abyssi TaxID=322596 RepID=A0ABX5Z5Y9_9MICO|nr:ABC transporter ATP-binding protein [Dermacoccus barathri]MBE7372749.1 ABC transporter ATP-binding protein [Dermacoccus barathri]QEH92153.1 ABC transporter ATP-binding protein [Dermacoccus abyssi]